MMNIYNTLKEEFSLKTIRKMTGVVFLATGILLLIGTAGESDTNQLFSILDIVISSSIGIVMTVVGAWLLKLFYSQSESEEDMIGLMAYHPKYNSWIMVVEYYDNDDWVFKFCNEDGKFTDTRFVHTCVNFNRFDWEV